MTPLIRAFAVEHGLVDHGLTSRKIHRRPIPRLGGVGIVTAFFAALLVIAAVSDGAWPRAEPRLLGLFAGGIAIAVLGFCDDLRGVSPRSKLLVQLGVAALAWSVGYRIEIVSLPIIGLVDLGPLALPLTLLWITGVTNALNLVDGLDGLAAGVALVILVSLFFLGLGLDDPMLVLVSATLAGAVAGFLVFNVHPASIFMGDTGSMFIGFVLAVLSIQASRTSSNAVALLVPVLALGYPIADTFLAMARRALRGVPVSSADRAHIHHRLLARGFSQRETALILSIVTAVFCGAALALSIATDYQALLVLACLGGGLLVGLRRLGFLDWNKLRDLAKARQDNLERLGQVSQLAEQLQLAADPEALGASLAAAPAALHVDRVALTTRARSWSFGAERDPGLLVVRYPLQPELSSGDVLEVGWKRGTAESDRDTEIAIEQLCPHLRAALRRLGPTRRLPARTRHLPGPLRMLAPRASETRTRSASGSVVGELRALVEGKRALVTGAAGKVGGELCRQLARLDVAELVMVDMNENELCRTAHALGREAPEVAVFPELVNVREYERLARVCERHRPELVLHAAAHSCVPFMEEAPEEAVKNNVFGTLNVAVVAHESRAAHLVVISSDQAVNPTSVVGATKRIAELVVCDLARRSNTSMTAVRFGDVVDDASGVAPSAVRLVLLAGLGRHGDLCVVDTGSETRRALLAEESEETAQVRDRIAVAKSSPPPPELARQLHQLQEHAMGGHRELLLSSIQRLVPTFRPPPVQPRAVGSTPLAAVQVRRRVPTPLPGQGLPTGALPVQARSSGTPIPTPALSMVSSSDEGTPQRRLPGGGWWHSIMTR